MAALFGLGLKALSSRLPGNHQRLTISGGKRGTAQTIARMRKLVTTGKREFKLRTAVGKLLEDCPAKDYECFARAVHQFCTHKIRYVFDPNGVELIEAPYRILESGIADCDSIVVLASAMLESIGLPCRFVTIKADRSRPNEYSHVFMEVKIPRKGWVAMDCTMPDQPFGWKPPGTYPRKNWPASNDATESHDTDEMAGLGMDVPYVENTVGVMVGKDWDFREESSLVTGSPEAMELSAFSGQRPSAPGAPRDEFFTQAGSNDFMKEHAATTERLTDDRGPALEVSDRAPGGISKQFLGWALVGGLVLGALGFWGKKR